MNEVFKRTFYRALAGQKVRVGMEAQTRPGIAPESEISTQELCRR